MQKYISKLHYLTQDLPKRSHIEQVKIACKAGANWIQYRCFSKKDEQLITEINQIAAICDEWGTTLILTDHYHLLNRVDAQGVHLEDIDADFETIRNEIGDDKTLGASATSFEDIQRIAASGVVDYVGCGPFFITLTKPNNYPLLGVEGYRTIVKQMKSANIHLPILAVGGINLTDMEALLDTGVYGIAVSAAINTAKDPEAAFKDFYRCIY